MIGIRAELIQGRPVGTNAISWVVCWMHTVYCCPRSMTNTKHPDWNINCVNVLVIEEHFGTHVRVCFIRKCGMLKFDAKNTIKVPIAQETGCTRQCDPAISPSPIPNPYIHLNSSISTRNSGSPHFETITTSTNAESEETEMKD